MIFKVLKGVKKLFTIWEHLFFFKKKGLAFYNLQTKSNLVSQLRDGWYTELIKSLIEEKLSTKKYEESLIKF